MTYELSERFIRAAAQGHTYQTNQISIGRPYGRSGVRQSGHIDVQRR